MNKVYNHTRKNINRITLIYILSLIPLILYGTYKNGVLLYLNKYVPIYGIFRPILFCLVPFGIYMLYSLIKERKLKLNIDAFYYMAIGIFMPPETSLLKYSLALLVLIPLIDLIPLEFNKGSAIKLILILVISFILIIKAIFSLIEKRPITYEVISDIFKSKKLKRWTLKF